MADIACVSARIVDVICSWMMLLLFIGVWIELSLIAGRGPKLLVYVSYLLLVMLELQQDDAIFEDDDDDDDDVFYLAVLYMLILSVLSFVELCIVV